MFGKKFVILVLCLMAVPCVALASASGKAKVKIYYTADTYGYLEACPS